MPPQASPEEEPTSPDSAAAAAAAAGAPAGVDGAAAAAAAAATSDSSSSSGALGLASTPTIAANRASGADSDVTRANQGLEHNASMENGNRGNPGGGISGGHGIGGVDEGGGDVEGVGGGRGRAEIEPSMEFTSFDGKPRTVNLLRESVYLTDMDLTRFAHERKRFFIIHAPPRLDTRTKSHVGSCIWGLPRVHYKPSKIAKLGVSRPN